MSLGLHRAKVYPSDEVPSIAAEARKRVFAAVFRMDKGVATFTGRPPLFSRRYTTPQSLPLDVSDEALLAGGEILASAIASLDENGFNTDGKIYSPTILRARTLLALVRDEILEIALGSNEPDDILELAVCVCHELGNDNADNKLQSPEEKITRNVCEVFTMHSISSRYSFG
jgi:hypothetical protein